MSHEEFKKAFRARFADELRLHREVALFLEPAIAAARPLPDAAHLAIDMLFVQSYKAHLSVLVVAEFGHVEDAATLARRLLELAVSAAYILALDDPTQRMPRATRFLADLWRDLADTAKARLPEELRSRWSRLTAGAPPGGLPGRQKMFSVLNQQATYDADYKLLTRIAHGGASDQIMAYSTFPVQVRDTRHLGTLLVYASRYYLAVAVSWNELYKRLEEAPLEVLIRRIDEWAVRAAGDDPSPEAA